MLGLRSNLLYRFLCMLGFLLYTGYLKTKHYANYEVAVGGTTNQHRESSLPICDNSSETSTKNRTCHSSLPIGDGSSETGNNGLDMFCNYYSSKAYNRVVLFLQQNFGV